MKPILECFPTGSQPRDVQRELLLSLEQNWSKYDVFVVVAPTGAGKSLISMTAANWLGQLDILTPTNILVDQYVKANPHYPKLLKADLYPCCKRYGKKKHICDRQIDRKKVFSQKKGIFNYYMYMSLLTQRRSPAPNLVIDEAHNLIPTLGSLMAKKIWQHQWSWPSSLSTYKDLHKWCIQKRGMVQDVEKEEVLDFIIEECETERPAYVFEKTTEWWTKGKTPERVPVINMKPVDVAKGPGWFWNPQVKKLIMMSATISKHDIKSMGLDDRRVLYIECRSPIPVESRPIYFNPLLNVNKDNLDNLLDILILALEESYLPIHVGEKGLIHLTYEMSDILRKKVGRLSPDSPLRKRLIFHDSFNKTSQYQKFLSLPPEEGHVLVACGLYEGVDLPGDLGRWQIIAKVPWLSLGDRAIQYKSEKDPEWYVWETLKSLIQASGRICRGPDDHGTTYIVDSTFKRLYNQGTQAGLIPKWFIESVEKSRLETLEGEDLND